MRRVVFLCRRAGSLGRRGEERQFQGEILYFLKMNMNDAKYTNALTGYWGKLGMLMAVYSI